MLRRFDWIRSSGIFEDFHWEDATADFARINVFLGANGSGKSSLSHALGRAHHDEQQQLNLSLVIDQDQQRRSTSGHQDSFFERIHVFNADFVRRAHRFSDDTPSMQGVLTIGERTVEDDERLVALKAAVPDLVHKRDTHHSALESAQGGYQKALESISKNVVNDLTKLGGKYQSRSHYSKATVEKNFKMPRTGWKVLTTTELQADKELVLSSAPKPIGWKAPNIDFHEALAREATECLEATPTTLILNTLRSHPEASTWVKEGRLLHQDLDTCLFCSGELKAERKSEIDAHFSNEVARLEARIEALLDDLEMVRAASQAAIDSIPDKANAYVDLQTAFEIAAHKYRLEATSLIQRLDTAREKLQKKLQNVLEPVAEPSILPFSHPDGNKVEELSTQHDDRVLKHHEHVQAAAERIEKHHLKDAEGSVDSLARSIGTSAADYEGAKQGLRATEDEIASLENVDGDVTPSEAVLNREVARLLGRDELKFESLEGRYQVTRFGQPATGLSEGERTAITLVHFMEVVARYAHAGNQPIVVIDDPVSSLDSNIFMGVSTYIWTECVSKNHVSQLFLLTHNFELFRQWDVQLESLHKNGTLAKAFPAEMYQLSPYHATASGVTKRKPRIVSWTPTPGVRKKLRSTYHHAFLSIVEAKDRLERDDSYEHRLDAQLLFPNVIRRMLETFMGFKRPEYIGDFTASMRASEDLLKQSDYEGDPSALRQQLTRYAHAYSHSETPDVTMTIDHDEIASAIASTFMFMHQVDKVHFEGLCRVITKKPKDLLPGPYWERIQATDAA